MGDLEQTRRFAPAAIAAAAATAAMVAVIGLAPETPAAYADSIGTAAAALLAAVLCLRAGASQSGRRRRMWLLIGAACSAWTVGELIWGYYDLVLRREVPVPSWADLGYLGAIPLAVAGLLSHPAFHLGRLHTARSLLDAVALAIALLFLSWTFALGPLSRDTDLSTASGLVSLAYPFGDVVLVFVVLLVVRRIAAEARTALWCLLAGLVLMGVTDSAYAYLVQVKEYEAGNLVDAGWVAAYLCLALAGFSSSPEGQLAPREARPTGIAPVVAPLLAMLAALTVIGVEAQLGRTPDTPTLLLACSLIATILVRQALLVLDLSRSREGTLLERVYKALVEPEATRA